MTASSCFLVDLDDTLFSELDYVDSGYRAIAPAMAGMCDASSIDVLFRLRYELRKFDTPDIRFYSGAREALANLRRSAPVAIVTDGNVTMQRRKIDALQLEPAVDAIVLCWECDAPKPATRAFELAASKLGRDLKTSVIIGDDPIHDMAAAAAIGCRGVRIRTGRLSDLDYPGGEEYSAFTAAVAALVRG
jgi:FMN phosphatase YigB (HAD superfamily)